MKKDGAPVERPREERRQQRAERREARRRGDAKARETAPVEGAVTPEPARAAAHAATRPEGGVSPARKGGGVFRLAARAGLALVGVTAACIALIYAAPKTVGSYVNSYKANGEVAVPGLAAPLEILRDRVNTPYIFAETWRDALFGQGFALGQDRLFQMEIARLYAAGRLAEVAGPGFLPGDRMARTMDLRGLAARRVTDALDEASLLELNALAAGLNAFIEARPEDLPAELALIGVETPEPWTAIDLMSIVYLQSWFFSIPMLDAEITAQALMERFEGDQAMAEAFFPFVENPDDPGSGLAIDQRRAARERPYVDLDLDPNAALWGVEVEESGFGDAMESGASGSNNWAFSGARLGRKAAVFANDPHLDIRRLPGPWHPIGLFTEDGIQAVGANVGLPGLVVGRTQAAAFGVTIGYADVLDFYVETIDPARPGYYREGDGEAADWARAEERLEIIKVLEGGSLREERLVVRRTPRGPLLPDFGLVGRADKALSLRWALAAPEMARRSEYSFAPLMRAGSTEEAIAAMERLGEASLNFVAGDVEGVVGRRSTGFLPDRALSDGLTPLPAAMAEAAWTGFVTGADLPGVIAPESGWAGSANHSVAPIDFGRPFSDLVTPAYRYRRMKALFDGAAPLDAALAAQAQRDVVNLFAEQMAPIIVKALDNDAEGRVETAAAAEILSGWSRRDEAEAAGPLVFQEIIRQTAIQLYEAALGPELARKMLQRREFWQERFARVMRAADGPVFEAAGLLPARAPGDEVGAGGAIGRDVLIRQATVAAMARLERLHGPDPRRWRWGDALKIRLDGPIPAPAGYEFAAGPLGHRLMSLSGSAETLDRAHNDFFPPDPDQPLEAVSSAASLRIVIDLADDEKIQATIAGGVTGRTLHPHLDDQLAVWARTDAANTLWFAPDAVRANAATRLILTPR
ncbi:MAG: penicillin acylase family protein [Pseudomonadota bacterium]